MESPTVMLSIIIPCFNHGQYIQEALDSIKKDEIRFPVEIIIVDDGSTDEFTISKLDVLKTQGYKVFHQKNSGPAVARNKGIENASGKYILPLDADNKITTDYINIGIPILEKGECQIVYAKATFFGDIAKKERIFSSGKFEASKLLEGNFIDNCSIFLKEVWTKNKGYDTLIPRFGYEDWEFWINAYSNGFTFHFINKELFSYRILNNSLAGNSDNYLIDSHRYILNKHSHVLLTELARMNYIKRKYTRDINRWLISIFIFLGYKSGLIKTPFEKAEEKIKL